MTHIDLLLLHPPSVYDFRQMSIMYGPVSDLIPSSTVFEMYPLGFLTMTSYLEARGLKVRIVNLALRMMNDAAFDVPTFLAQLNPKAIGIDPVNDPDPCVNAVAIYAHWRTASSRQPAPNMADTSRRSHLISTRYSPRTTGREISASFAMSSSQPSS